MWHLEYLNLPRGSQFGDPTGITIFWSFNGELDYNLEMFSIFQTVLENMMECERKENEGEESAAASGF